MRIAGHTEAHRARNPPHPELPSQDSDASSLQESLSQDSLGLAVDNVPSAVPTTRCGGFRAKATPPPLPPSTETGVGKGTLTFSVAGAGPTLQRHELVYSSLSTREEGAKVLLLSSIYGTEDTENRRGAIGAAQQVNGRGSTGPCPPDMQDTRASPRWQREHTLPAAHGAEPAASFSLTPIKHLTETGAAAGL